MNVLFVLVTALLSAAKQIENFVLLIEIQFLFNKQIHVAFDWAEMTEGEIFGISSFCMHQAQQGLCRKKKQIPSIWSDLSKSTNTPYFTLTGLGSMFLNASNQVMLATTLWHARQDRLMTAYPVIINYSFIE